LSAVVLSSAYASAAVALIFLVVDAVRGDPFLTPSLMGSVVFLGLEPSRDLPVRLDMVAPYSLAHLAAFATLAALATVVTSRSSALRDRQAALPALLFASLMGGALLIDGALFPGLLEAIGLLWVTIANAGAAWVMGRIIRNTLADEEILSLIDAVVRVTEPIARE
jgi:hypothetical protein